MPKTFIRKRVNIMLSEQTIRLIDRVAEKGGRSRFLDSAAHFYAHETSRANMHRLLREGAIARSERDLGLAEEWFCVEYDSRVWPKRKRK